MIHMVAIFRFSKTKEKKNIPTCLKFYIPHELIELEANRDDFDVKESSDGADLVVRDSTDLALRDSTDSVDRDCARDCTDLALGDSADLVDRDSTFLNLVFNLFAPKTKISSDGSKVFSCEKVFGFFCGPNFTKKCMEKGIRSVSFVETDLAYKSIMCSYKQWDTESALLQQDDTQLLLTNTAIASPPPPGNQLLLTNDSIASSRTPEMQMLFTNSSSNIDQPNNDGESFTPKVNDGENLIIGEESNLESLQIVDKENYIGEEDGMINEEDDFELKNKYLNDKLIDEDGNEHNIEHEEGNSIVAKPMFDHGEEQNMEKECNEDRFDEAKQSDGMVIRNNKDEGEEVIGQGCEGDFSSDSERKYKEDYYVSSSDSETKCK